MKKSLLAILSLLSVGLTSVNAQSFTVQKDTAKGYVSNSGYELHNDLTNKTAGNITVYWKIVNHNLPASTSWVSSFGLCDNVTCYSNAVLSGTQQEMAPIFANATSPFKIQYGDLSAATGTGPYYITVELSSGTTVDTAVFQLNKFSTSVSNTNKQNDNIVVYPNPARNEVNVVFDRSSDISHIAVYNLIGKAVTVYKVSGNSAKLDIDNIPSGIYFLRMLDSQGHVIATRKFTHQ